MHARPCFYCIILLTTLFISTCYWQPFPLDTPLVVPWSENITTFGDALNATISKDYNKPLPSVIRAVDRCWCDFSTNGFFEPYDVAQWEQISIEKLKVELEKQATAEAIAEYAAKAKEGEATDAPTDPSPAPSMSTISIPGMPRTVAPNPAATTPSVLDYTPSFYQNILWLLFWPLVPKPESNPPVLLPSRFVPQPDPSATNAPLPSSASVSSTPDNSTDANTRLPLFRREYDLRPIGLDITIDFGWSRRGS